MTPPPESPSPDPQEKLTQFVHATLRDLPPRRAPRTLESRVMAEIARRAALPWWRKSFAHWPLSARALFLLVCAGFVKLGLAAAVWIAAGFNSSEASEAFAEQTARFGTFARVTNGLLESAAHLVGDISSLWLYGAAAAVIALYLAVFGLGAAAYRTLYINR